MRWLFQTNPEGTCRKGCFLCLGCPKVCKHFSSRWDSLIVKGACEGGWPTDSYRWKQCSLCVCVCHQFNPHPERMVRNCVEISPTYKLKGHYWLVVWNIFYVSICWEESSQLTNIFQRGWNHQPAISGVEKAKLQPKTQPGRPFPRI